MDRQWSATATFPPSSRNKTRKAGENSLWGGTNWLIDGLADSKNGSIHYIYELQTLRRRILEVAFLHWCNACLDSIICNDSLFFSWWTENYPPIRTWVYSWLDKTQQNGQYKSFNVVVRRQYHDPAARRTPAAAAAATAGVLLMSHGILCLFLMRVDRSPWFRYFQILDCQ